MIIWSCLSKYDFRNVLGFDQIDACGLKHSLITTLLCCIVWLYWHGSFIFHFDIKVLYIKMLFTFINFL
jgi:hypothetical protein